MDFEILSYEWEYYALGVACLVGCVLLTFTGIVYFCAYILPPILRKNKKRRYD